MSDWSSDVCSSDLTVHWPGSLTSSSQGSRRATSSAAVFETEVKAADPQELAAGLVTTATATVPIPMSAPPTMQGRYARYEWRVRARVEMKGNAPDSGWGSGAHTTELQTPMRSSYAPLCLENTNNT